ncbi:restriction endonuclease subunit S [Parabacteroides distasonis]|nr:restriction endonuclease subunit S [Parabacteroides distasonis]WMI44979.1 restriction endonuclease subunit S [Parabacteroides distasonis]
MPESWVWCRLEDIAYVASGSTPDKTCFVKDGIPYIKMYNLRNQEIDFDYQPQYITEEIHNSKLQRSRTEVGDLIMNIVGPPLGKLAVIPATLPQANFNQAAVLIRPYKYKEDLVLYLKSYLEEMSEINSIATRGSAGQVNISLTQSQNMRIPLPPLAEQQRIIAEISKWFALINQIEQGKADLQTIIKQTKSKILDLAIHGKLVPQDPNDEPAIKLLKRINPDFTPCDNRHYTQLPFEAPQNWCWTTLGKIGKWQSGSTPNRLNKDYYNGNIPWLKTGDLNDGYITHIPEYITEKALNETSVKLNSTGSVLIAMYGATIGKIGILTFPATTNQACCACEVFNGIDKEFLFLFLLSHREEFIKMGGGGAQPNISKEKILNTYIPLPPFAEQKRIVNAVNELFTKLDTIMESL